MATALLVRPDVAVTETAGEDLASTGSGLLVRSRSALGLILLIAALGLAFAAVLAAAIAALSAAVDGFVN